MWMASLGDYYFDVHIENLATFTDLKFSNSVTFQEHKLLGRRSTLEFTGINASTCSFNMHLEYGLAADLYGTIDYFYQAMNDGTALLFMIGPDIIGQGFWVIESIDESYSEITIQGDIVIADLAIKMKEYLPDERDDYDDDEETT